MPAPMISRKELARRLGKSERTIDNWRGRRLISSSKIAGSVMFDYEEVLKEIRESRPRPAVPRKDPVYPNLTDRQFTELIIGRRI